MGRTGAARTRNWSDDWGRTEERTTRRTEEEETVESEERSESHSHSHSKLVDRGYRGGCVVRTYRSNSYARSRARVP